MLHGNVGDSILDKFSLVKPNKIIGVANTQPNIYKKGINIIVDINFEFKKNNFVYIFPIN